MQERGVVADRVGNTILILGGFIALLWLLELIDVIFLDQSLNGLGVRPRTPNGLWGILFMPLLHANYGHLAANTLPLLVLGGIVMLRRFKDFIVVTAVTLLITGLGLWLLGNGRAVYIGASGLVFGYFGFLLVRGYFDRSAKSILIAILVFIFYGGLLWGLLPQQQPGVSWGAHLLGFIGGVVSAKMVGQRPAAPPITTEEDLSEQIRILS